MRTGAVTLVCMLIGTLVFGQGDPIAQELDRRDNQAKRNYERALKRNKEEAVRRYNALLAKQKQAGSFSRALETQNRLNKLLGLEQIVLSVPDEAPAADTAPTTTSAPAVKAVEKKVLTADETVKFKSGAVPHGSYLYKVFSETKPISWESAKIRCELMGGNLASIENRAENEFVAELIKTTSKALTPAWIGGVRKSAKDPWEWSDKAKFSFYYWLQDEPNKAEGFNYLITNAEGQRGLWATRSAAANGAKPVSLYVCRWFDAAAAAKKAGAGKNAQTPGK